MYNTIMKLDGKIIAQQILEDLKKRVGELEKKGVAPHFAVILVGDDASSTAYVKQKELKSLEVGIKVSIFRFPPSLSEKDLLQKVHELNNDPEIHGIIIQRPLPPHIDPQKITDATFLKKDVDGFSKDSPFSAPVALAVMRLLEEAKKYKNATNDITSWLSSQKIVILGKGKTAGWPIITFFRKHQIPLTIIDSRTENKAEILKQADIVISSVGKPHVFDSSHLKTGVILIGVGMFLEDGKIRGDYKVEDIEDIASFYTGVPGGVGPVNVAFLLTNVIKAADNSLT